MLTIGGAILTAVELSRERRIETIRIDNTKEKWVVGTGIKPYLQAIRFD